MIMFSTKLDQLDLHLLSYSRSAQSWRLEGSISENCGRSSGVTITAGPKGTRLRNHLFINHATAIQPIDFVRLMFKTIFIQYIRYRTVYTV